MNKELLIDYAIWLKEKWKICFIYIANELGVRSSSL